MSDETRSRRDVALGAIAGVLGLLAVWSVRNVTVPPPGDWRTLAMGGWLVLPPVVLLLFAADRLTGGRVRAASMTGRLLALLAALGGTGVAFLVFRTLA